MRPARHVAAPRHGAGQRGRDAGPAPGADPSPPHDRKSAARAHGNPRATNSEPARTTAGAAQVAPVDRVAPGRSGLRLALAAGMITALPVALWWLGGTRLALMQGADTVGLSAAALQLLWLLRALGLPLLALRVGALSGWRTGAAAGLTALAPAWPLAALAWSASNVPASSLLLAEGVLVGAAIALPQAGAGLRRVLHRRAHADAVATAAAIALAAMLWAGGAGLGPWPR